jgi:DNA helicase-2/ATP-dependent DNA helicase PcrA
MSITLNAAQQQAVEHNSGEMLVVAGAGTGKTSVIVERIARLVASGVDKQQLLALTFTEKAAQEMLDRVSDRLEKSYGVEMAIHTFNGFGQKILQEFAVEIGLSSSFRLVGDDGKIIFLREHLDELELDYFAPISRPDSQLSTIADYFSELKQHLVAPADYIV